MRQTQSNRRGRGRSRKAQNPLTRNYESNGPDVKIRGTASHISEKYLSLARDALSSSDIVRHENYMQHAEHYNRIIMAAQQNNNNAENSASVRGDNEAGDKSKAANGRDQEASDGQKKHRGDARKNGRRRRNESQGQKANKTETEKSETETIAMNSKADEASRADNKVAETEKSADDAAA